MGPLDLARKVLGLGGAAPTTPPADLQQLASPEMAVGDLHSPVGDASLQQRAQAEAEQHMTQGDGFLPMEPPRQRLAVGTPPYLMQYAVGHNLNAIPRSVDSITGLSMDSLMYMGVNAPKVQDCIDIIATHVGDLDCHLEVVDPRDAGKYDHEMRETWAWLEVMGDAGTGLDIHDHIRMWTTQTVWLDANPLYLHPSRDGSPGSVEPIDGTTIALLVDGRGAVPRGDASAYVQWLWGANQTEIPAERLVYRRRWPTAGTRYGFPRLEYLARQVSIQIRNYEYVESYYTGGQMPELGVVLDIPPQDTKLIGAYQTSYDNRTRGAQAAGTAHIFPKNTTLVHLNKTPWDVTLINSLNLQFHSSLHVTPFEAGDPQQGGGLTSMGKDMEDVEYRLCIKPMCGHTAREVAQILRWYCSYRWRGRVPFKLIFDNAEDEEAALVKAQRYEKGLDGGWWSLRDVMTAEGREIPEDMPDWHMRKVGNNAIWMTGPKAGQPVLPVPSGAGATDWIGPAPDDDQMAASGTTDQAPAGPASPTLPAAAPAKAASQPARAPNDAAGMGIGYNPPTPLPGHPPAAPTSGLGLGAPRGVAQAAGGAVEHGPWETEMHATKLARAQAAQAAHGQEVAPAGARFPVRLHPADRTTGNRGQAGSGGAQGVAAVCSAGGRDGRASVAGGGS